METVKEKKEIGTLIELLNEYVEKYNKSDLYYTFELDKDCGWLSCYDDITDHKGWCMQDVAMVICNKKFGFIKWLVDNDKIDTNKIKSRMIQVFEFRFQEYANYENTLLMLLSISDTPIDDLCSYLS